jgi:hypothetical protein
MWRVGEEEIEGGQRIGQENTNLKVVDMTTRSMMSIFGRMR